MNIETRFKSSFKMSISSSDIENFLFFSYSSVFYSRYIRNWNVGLGKENPSLKDPTPKDPGEGTLGQRTLRQIHWFLKSFKRAQFCRNREQCASWSAKELAEEIAFVLHAK